MRRIPQIKCSNSRSFCNDQKNISNDLYGDTKWLRNHKNDKTEGWFTGLGTFIMSLILLVPVVISCMPEPQSKRLTYQNFIILADMSSRLTNRPPKDIEEIQKIVDIFLHECVKPDEKIGDRSSISFAALSEKIHTSLDLEQFKDIAQKQSFINSTGQFTENGLQVKLEEFMDDVIQEYESVRNPGLDVISLLIDNIENSATIKKNRIVMNGNDTLFINYDNHIYLFTDGYLEYQQKHANSQYYFGHEEINKIRRYCSQNDVDVTSALEQNPELGLPPYARGIEEEIHLHVLETHERDKNLRLQTYLHPIGLRDNEILESVWRKWADESGFKSFEWRKY